MKRFFSYKTAVFLMVIGLIIYGGAYVMGASGGIVYFDNSGLHVERNVNGSDGTYTQYSGNTESFRQIHVNTSTADIELIPSNRYAVDIKIPGKSRKFRYDIDDGRLTISTDNEGGFLSIGSGGWFFNLFNFSVRGGARPVQSHVKVYYPEGALLDDVNLTSDSGSVSVKTEYIEQVSAGTSSGEIDIKADGDIVNLFANTHTGRINVEADWIHNVRVESSSGSVNVKLDDGIVESSYISTHTGRINVDGENMHNLRVESSSGTVNVKGHLLGKTLVSTHTGRIEIQALGHISMYGYELESTTGRVRINDSENITNSGGHLTVHERGRHVELTGMDNMIHAQSSSGSISLDFD